MRDVRERIVEEETKKFSFSDYWLCRSCLATCALLLFDLGAIFAPGKITVCCTVAYMYLVRAFHFPYLSKLFFCLYLLQVLTAYMVK